MRRDLGLEVEVRTVDSGLPEEDVTNFCLWLKETLSSKVQKVQLSKRLKGTPAVVVGQVSSSMFMIMQMMQ